MNAAAMVLPSAGLTARYNIPNSSAGSTQLRSAPLEFGYSGGYYTSGSLRDEDSYGYYWSRSANSGTNAYNLNFNSGLVYPQDNYNRGYGLAVRCVEARDDCLEDNSVL